MSRLPPFPAPVLVDPEAEPGYMKHYVPLPEAVADALDGHDRVEGTLGGHAFRRTVQRRPDGARWLRFGAGWLRDAGLAVGEVVLVEVGPDLDPDRVDLPAELEAALALDPEAARAWDALPPGKRRTLAYGVGRAKRPETRERRALALAEAVRTEG
ncbi:MAG: YdeI/OmpD-associated family protein [Bacteroidota bacterium]